MHKCFLSFAIIFLATFTNAQIFVSKTGSDKNGNGTESMPFATLSRAIRALTPTQNHIVIKEGVYETLAPVIINKFGFDKKNIVIEGRGNVELIGAKRVSATLLEKVDDKEFLSKFRNPEISTLYKLDLKKLGITNYGKLRKRGFACATFPMQMEVFYSASRELQLAKYPNFGTLHIGKLIDAGFAPSEQKNPTKEERKRLPKFISAHEIAPYWYDDDDLWISGILSYGWCDDHQRIKKIDRKTNEIELSFPHCYGVMSSHPDFATNKQDISVRGYYIYNSLQEIDTPYEYYIDRKQGIFYVSLPAKPSDNAYFDFTITENPLISILDSKDILIKNITLSSGRGNGLEIYNSQRIEINNCTIKNFGLTGAIATISEKTPSVVITKYKFSKCTFFDNGAGGLDIGGGDRKKLTPARNRVEDCLFYNNCRIKKNYAAGVKISGVATSVGHCEFRDTEHQHLTFTGNDHTIEFSIFADGCKNASDMGVIYTGRNPSNRGIQIRNNFFTNIQGKNKESKVCSIYIDDGSGGMKIYKNIFCRATTSGYSDVFGAIFLHGGHDNIIDKNVFIDCEASVGHTRWENKKWKKFITEDFYHLLKKEVDIESEPYKKYPELKDFLTTDRERFNHVMNSLFYKTRQPYWGDFRLSNKQSKLVPSSKPKVKKWTLKDVKKYFGENELVDDILKKEIGIRK